MLNLSPLSKRAPTRDDAPPPEFPALRDAAAETKGRDDLPKTPRWKKVLGALFKASTVAVPAAGAGYVGAHVQIMHQQPAAQQQVNDFAATQTDVGLTLDSANIDALVSQLTVIVPQENTEPKRAETKVILEEACEHVKSLAFDLAGDAFKEAIKAAVLGGPIYALSQFLKRRAAETGNKSIGWSGEAAEKIAELFGKHPIINVVTSKELNDVFGDKTMAAETMLLMLGYKKRGNQWQRA